MSNVIQSDSQIAKLIDGYDFDDRGSALGAPYWMEAALSEIKTFMSMNIDIDGVPTPRYGVLSLLLHSTPCFVYGHPEFKKQFGTTAFTDGVHIFICEDLMEKMIKEEDESKGKLEGVIPLVMHELSHKLLNHHGRLRSYPRDIANKAADYSINSRIQLGYPEIKWVPSLRETGVGFLPGELEKYSVLSEETIARDLWEDRLKQQREQESKQNNQGQGGPGQSQPGQGNPGQGQPGQGQDQGGKGQGKGSPGQGGKNQKGQPNGEGEKGGDAADHPESFGADGDEHMPDLEDIVRVMKQNGMDAALAKLGIHDANDVEEIGQVKKDNELNKVEAIHKAAAQMAQANGKYPGAHLATAAADMIISQAKGKLHWKMSLREMILGDGGRYRPSMEESSSLYYIDEVEDMLGARPWLPVELAFKPQEVVMIPVDTSGSVSNEDLKEFFAEIFELVTASSGFGDAASEVIVVPADTAIREEPTVITPANVEEFMNNGIRVLGRGGTDFGDVIRSCAKLPQVKGKKIKSWVYFTDLFDRAPKSKAEVGLEEDVNFVFVAARSTGSAHVAEFAKDVESWARVAEIHEGVEVDLSETSMDMPVQPSRRRPGA